MKNAIHFILTLLLPIAVWAQFGSPTTDANGNLLTPLIASNITVGTIYTLTNKEVEIRGSLKATNLISAKDVRFYGAKGDGATDDTAALQAAFNSGNDIYIPKGTYKLSDSLFLTRDNQKLYGPKDAILKQTHASHVNMIVSNASHVTIAGITLQGYGALSRSGYYERDTCFYGTNAQYLTIDSVTVTNMKYSGIVIRNSGNVTVKSCVITGCPASVTGTGWDSQAAGYKLDSTDLHFIGTITNAVVINNHCISGSGIGIWFLPYDDHGTQRKNRIEGNTVRNHNQYGILLYQTALYGPGANAEKISIVNNIVSDIWGLTKNINGITDYGHGISSAGFNDVDISFNVVSNTCLYSRGTDLYYAGISVGNSSHFRVSNNRIFDSFRDAIYTASSNVTTLNRSASIAQISDNYLLWSGKVTNKVSITSGSAVLSVATTNFLIGDSITVIGAGASGGNLTATITGHSGLTYTLNATASTTVTDGRAQRGTGYGIRVGNIGRISVTGNKLSYCYPYGVYFYTNAGPVILSGNQVLDDNTPYAYTFHETDYVTAVNNIASASYSWGMQVGVGCQFFNIIGNILLNTATGISIDSTSSHVFMSGNTIMATTGISNNSSSWIRCEDQNWYGTTTRYGGTKGMKGVTH